MDDVVSNTRRWEDLDTDILVKIFQLFDIFELTYGVAHVCSAWRAACCDPLRWKTLDLSMLRSNFIKTPLEPFVYVNERSDKKLTLLLKVSLSLSRQSIVTLIFHFNLYVSGDMLTYTAERSPQLKRLVLPAWNRIKRTGMCKAIRSWKKLESLTMPSIADPQYFLEEIAKNCENFSELKIMGPCNIFFASTLAAFVPKLRVLSLRCTTLHVDVLIFILDSLKHLEVLNISHCVLMEFRPRPQYTKIHLEVLNISHCVLMEGLPPPEYRIITEIDPAIRQKANRLREFITCMDNSCIMCQRTRTDEGIVRWYKYEEGFWKEDEVKSLAL